MPKGWKVGFVHNCEQTNAFYGKKVYVREAPPNEMQWERPPGGMVWYGIVVWYGMAVWYDMVWYDMVRCGMVWYGMVWYGRIRHELDAFARKR